MIINLKSSTLFNVIELLHPKDIAALSATCRQFREELRADRGEYEEYKLANKLRWYESWQYIAIRIERLHYEDKQKPFVPPRDRTGCTFETECCNFCGAECNDEGQWISFGWTKR